MTDIKLEYPCVCCQGGDPWSNMICDDCESNIEHRKEVREAMISLVCDINNISGDVPSEISDKIRDAVDPIYEQLVNIQIKL